MTLFPNDQSDIMERISARSTMRAAVVTGPGRMHIEERPLPTPQAGEVRVRLEGCGVCASNLVPWSGPEWMEFPLPPGDLGHEGWGYVDSIGANVDPGLLGQRVATLSHASYAEYDIAQVDEIVPLPKELDGRPVPGEPLGCAVNIFHRSGIRPGERVAIIGIGFLGALLTQLAANAGAKVIAISRRQSSLALAEQFGAATTIAMDDHWQIIETVSQLTKGRFCDVVIETAGKQWPLDLAAELCAERGRLIIAGYHQVGPRQVNMQLWNWRGLDVINAHERAPETYRKGTTEAIEAVVAGRLNPWPLLTHSYPLDCLGEALDDAEARPDGFVKAFVSFD